MKALKQTDRFLVCYTLVREKEGGNVDDPRDPGGRTSRGVTQRTYDAYCKLHGLPHGDVWLAPEISITQIYLEGYWLPWCPQLPVGLDLLFFDTAVLSGPHEAALILQKAVGVTVDGWIGHVTLAAVKAHPVAELIAAYTKAHKHFYHGLKIVRDFGHGWDNRLYWIEAKALGMVSPATTKEA